MATNQTTYYQLNQWLPEDAVLRADFNQDNAKVDQALRALDSAKADKGALNVQANRITQLGESAAAGLAGKGNCQIEFGGYVGTGGYGSLDPTCLSFSRTPALVFIHADYGRQLWLTPRMERSCSVTVNGSPDQIYVSWVENSVRFYSRSSAQEQMNVKDEHYFYLVLYALDA